MIWNLINKEIRIAAHPTLFIFALMGALVLVPAYPYGVVFMFGCLSPAISFIYARETNDVYFTSLLPVRKRDIVRGKYALVAMAQIFQLLFSVPFAILRLHILREGNPVGIEANVAFYGFGLMIFAIFDAVFLTQYYKTAYKAGAALVIASVPMALGIILMEVLVHIPSFAWLDATTPDALMRQLPILMLGALAYAMSMLITYRISAARFELVDL